MTISIVTAVYNRVETVSDALRSLQLQHLQDVEHIIQDGGSNDGTLDAVRDLTTAGTKVESAPDTGIYDALNKGIARATGDVIGLLHSDDLFANTNVLDRVSEAFADSDVDGVYGDLEYVAQDDPNRVIRYWRSGSYHPNLLRRGWMPPHPTLFLRREVFDRHGAYDTSFRIAADYEAMLRWLTKGQIRLAYIPEVLVKMRVGGESNRSLERILRKSREDLRAIRRHDIGGIDVLIAKNFGKVSQFIRRDRQQDTKGKT